MPLPRQERYTPEQLAELWGCSTPAIYDYVNSGRLQMKERMSDLFGFNPATGREEFVEHGLDRYFELDEVLRFETEHGIGQQEQPITKTKQRNPDNPKSKSTLLQMIAVMANKKYNYDPSGNSEVPQIIVDSAQKMGIVLDVKTVRGWLRQAAECIPSGE